MLEPAIDLRSYERDLGPTTTTNHIITGMGSTACRRKFPWRCLYCFRGEVNDLNHSFLCMVWCLGFEVGSSGGIVVVFLFTEIYIGKVPQSDGYICRYYDTRGTFFGGGHRGCSASPLLLRRASTSAHAPCMLVTLR